MQSWKEAFLENKWNISKDLYKSNEVLSIENLHELKDFLDIVHIRETLLRPYFETENYPLVEARALLPSFEADVHEYKELPGFSLIAFYRPLSAFNEIFQYDILQPIGDFSVSADGPCCPLESHIAHKNLHTMLARMPRMLHEKYRKPFQRTDITVLELYHHLLPYILEMDRAHVIAKSSHNHFQLSGVFASLPSDIDNEIKRFGLRINKFQMGDNDIYELNRTFVMQFLMELYGFPIVSERRSSAALFARRLHKMAERFIIRVLGQSDRTITTIWSDGTSRRYPKVEKIALIRLDEDQKDIIEALSDADAFVDKENKVIIIQVSYQQHAYDSANMRQGRALSVDSQFVIHPQTGERIADLNIIKDSTNLILRLNDIVRGEYSGRMLYKRTELVENTDTEEKRLKFLYAWMSKHQRRIIGYSEDFFQRVTKIMDNYLSSLHDIEDDMSLRELLFEVQNKYSFIQQARKVRYLEDIRNRQYKGEKLSYDKMLAEAITVAHTLRLELVYYFEDIATSALIGIENILNNRYICRNYIEKTDNPLTPKGLEIRKKYGKLVSLRDEIANIQKSHQNN